MWTRSRSIFNYKNDLSNFTKKNQMKEVLNDIEDDKGGGWVIMDKNYYWDKIAKKIYFLKSIKSFLLTVSEKSFISNLQVVSFIVYQR